MGASQDDLRKVRAYAESLSGNERSTFISKFKALKGEDSVTKLASRLPDLSSKQADPLTQFATDLKDSFVGAGVEMARGFQQQGADMFETLDYLTKKGTEITGIPRSGTFGELADVAKNSAESMPDTRLIPEAKATYNTIGKLPGQAAEFMTMNKGLNAVKVPAALKAAFGDIRATGQLSDAVTLGVQSAINEFRNSDSFSKAANAFSSGATTALSIGVIAEATPKALEIGKSMGRNAAKAFLKAVTGDEKFAEAFVKNPWKFNLNPFQKVRSLKDVEAENMAKISDLNAEYNIKVSDMKVKNAERKASLASELDRDFYSLKDKNRSLNKIVGEKVKADIEKVHGEASKAFDDTVNRVHAGLHSDLEEIISKVDLLEESLGKRVGQAVDNISNKDPFSRISKFKYMKKFEEVANRNGYLIKNGIVVPVAGQGTADEATLRLLQNNLNDINSVAEFSDIPLGFAQKKKELWYDLGYKGSEKANQVMQQLGGALNPVNMSDDIIGNDISAEISVLRAANKEYSEMVPRYQEAIKNFTKPDAQGKPVADFNNSLKALKNKDIRTLKQIAKADSLLPPEDRFMPKLHDAAKKLSEAENIKTANLKLAKKKAANEMAELNSQIRKKEFQVRQAQRENKFKEAQRLQGKLNEMRTVEKTKLERTIKAIQDDQEFVKQQEVARSFTPMSTTRRTVQGGALISAYANYANNPALASASGAASLILSPKVSSAGVKGIATAGRNSADTLLALNKLVNTKLGRVLTVKALSDPSDHQEK